MDGFPSLERPAKTRFISHEAWLRDAPVNTQLSRPCPYGSITLLALSPGSSAQARAARRMLEAGRGDRPLEGAR